MRESRYHFTMGLWLAVVAETVMSLDGLREHVEAVRVAIKWRLDAADKGACTGAPAWREVLPTMLPECQALDESAYPRKRFTMLCSELHEFNLGLVVLVRSSKDLR